MLQRRFEATCRLFAARGSSPLREWQVSGEVQHRASPAGDGFVYEMVEGSPATRIQTPRKGFAPLGLRHQRLVLDLYGDPALPFAVELVVCDAGGVTRTLTLSRDCTTPELRHGSPKAKLPLAPPPGVAPDSAGWRIVDVDLVDLVPRAFDGAIYKQLDGIAVVGACMLRTIEARAESPPAFTVAEHVPLEPYFTPPGLGRSGAADVYVAVVDEDDEEYGHEAYDESTAAFAHERPADRAARLAAKENRAFEATKLASRAAQAAFLRASRTPPSVDDEAEPAPPKGRPPKTAPQWQGAMKKLGAMRLAAAMAAPTSPAGRRRGDPRTHATGGAEGAHAVIYRRERLMGGKTVSDAAASTRSGVAAAQELCKRLRRGDAPPAVDMTGVAIGEGGTKLLTNALASERAASVRTLTLAYNRLGDRGAALLAGSLRSNHTLTAVDLHGCEVGPDGGVALAGAVEVGCPRLSSLVLSRNELGAAGVAALVRAAAVHTTLALLDLEHTGGASGLRALFQQGDEVRFEAAPKPPPREGAGAGADADAGADARARVVHVRTGRAVPRLDDGPAHDGQHTRLLGLREAIIGRTVDVRLAGRPALAGAFVNVASNAAVEALRETLLRPVRALRTLRLGGNPFGAAARDELKRALGAGPNGRTGFALKFHVDDGSAAAAPLVPASLVAEVGAQAGAPAEAGAEAEDAALAAALVAEEAPEAAAVGQQQQAEARRRLAEERRKVAAEQRRQQRAQRARQHALEAVFPEIGLQREQLQRSGTWAPEPSLVEGEPDVEADEARADAGSELDVHLDDYLEAQTEQARLAGSLPDGLSKSSLLVATAAMNKARVFSFAES